MGLSTIYSSEVFSDSLQNLQTLSVIYLQWATADSSFGLGCSFTEIWLYDELVQGVKPEENPVFCCASFLLT